MAINPITDGLPAELTIRLAKGEQVFYHMKTNTILRGDVTTVEKSWFCITNKRLIYDLTTDEGHRHQGDIPIEEVTYVHTKEQMASKGCSNPKYFTLSVGKPDWTVYTPVKTADIAQDILAVLEALRQQRI